MDNGIQRQEYTVSGENDTSWALERNQSQLGQHKGRRNQHCAKCGGMN